MIADMHCYRLVLVLPVLALSACAMPQTSQDEREASSPIPPAAQEEAILPGDVPVEGTSGTGAVTAIAERMLPGGMLEIGKADAPASLLVFTNHSCAYCRQFHRDQLPRLMAEYVAEGTLRITLVPFALQKYSDSERHAALALCAGKQGRGRAMHDALFGGADGDAAGLETCMMDPATAADLKAQRSWAHAMGVELIPTFIIDGDRITGLPEYPDLRGLIDAALVKADHR